MKRVYHLTLVFVCAGILVSSWLVYGNTLHQVNAMLDPSEVSSPPMGPFLDIWTDGVDNLKPAVAYNNLHDEYLVVWYTKQGDFTWDIWARRVGHDGELWSWFNIDSLEGKKLTDPAVVYNPDQDEYLIIYTREVAENSWDIIARRIPWNGSGSFPRIILDNPEINISSPSVAYNPQSKEYLVVYTKQIGGTNSEIFAKRLKGNDGTILSQNVITSGTNEYRYQPDIAFNPTRENYLIAYSLDSMAPGEIRARVVSADLSSFSPEFQISGSTNHEYGPYVAAGPDEFLVAWTQMDLSSSEYRVYGRRIKYDGTPQGPFQGFPIASSTTTTIMRQASDATYSPFSGYLVVSSYFNPSSADESNVYGRFILPGQDHAAGNEFPIDTSPHYQSAPAVACAPSGDCLVAEVHNPLAYPAGDMEIRGRLVYGRLTYLPAILRTFQ